MPVPAAVTILINYAARAGVSSTVRGLITRTALSSPAKKIEEIVKQVSKMKNAEEVKNYFEQVANKRQIFEVKRYEESKKYFKEKPKPPLKPMPETTRTNEALFKWMKKEYKNADESMYSILKRIADSDLSVQSKKALGRQFSLGNKSKKDVEFILDKDAIRVGRKPQGVVNIVRSKPSNNKEAIPKKIKTDIKTITSRKEKPKPGKLPIWATREAREAALRKEIREAIKAGKAPKLRAFGPLTKRETELIRIAKEEAQKPKIGPATKQEAELAVRDILKARAELKRNRKLTVKARREIQAEKRRREAWLAEYNKGRKTPEEGRIEIPKVETRRRETLKEREAYTNKEVGQEYKATKDTPPAKRDIYILLKNPITGKPVLRNGKKVYIKETINTNKGQSEELVRKAIERDLGNAKVLGVRRIGKTPSGKPIIIGYKTYTPKQWMRLAEEETEKRAVQGIIANTKAPEKISRTQIDKNIASQRKFDKEVATEKANKIDPIAQANALKKNLEQLQKELEKAINRQSKSRIDKLIKEKETLQRNLSLLEKRNKMTAPTRGA